MKKNIIIAIVAFGLIAGFAATAMAMPESKAKENAPDEEKVTKVSNKITGQISNIDTKTFAVVYDRNEATGEEFEMLFPIDKDLRVVHKNSFSELKVGDMVEVQFEDVATEKKDRKEGKRTNLVVTFVSPGAAIVEPTHAATTNTTAATENTESAAALPLKSDLRE
jgi:hypothetical protein